MNNATMESQVDLSVVIRTRNQAKSLRQILKALEAQRCTFKWEVIIVDHESQDETVELCKQYNARIISIRDEEFTHGRSVNLGISKARGELVLICSAHAVPAGSHFLESVVAPFTDSRVAAVRCIDGSDKQQLGEWYTARDIQYSSPEEQKTAEAGTGWISNYPSGTCCAIRRSVWEQIPYDEHLEALNDKLWASQVLSKGFKIRCRSDAVFIDVRKMRYIEKWRKQNRAYRDLYRARGYIPLSWSKFLVRLVRFALLTPQVATRYFVQNILADAGLVTIPWQAKFPPRVRPPDYYRSHGKSKYEQISMWMLVRLGFAKISSD
jgi:glycosyltransferase involved in cell wall biosynthesis